MSNLILEKSDDMEYLFKNCKLEREPIADNLTKIIENLGGKGSFVLGIDSPWGTGKTTFIKMWQKKLELEKSDKIFTIHFNAWENDFYGNVLLSLIGELDKYLDNSNKDVDKEDLKKVTGNIASSVVNFMTLGIINPKELYKELDGTKKRGLFNNYKEYKDLKERIKEDLTKIKEKLGVEKVIFFIDELDRCRPDYAIETLEKIKHLFGVDDYIYVLSLDKEQLSHSVSTIYGSGMDSEGYLRRFIDLDYSLPNPSKDNYIDYLMNKHDLDSNKDNIFYFDKVIKGFAREDEVSLRDLEKLFYQIKLILPLTTLLERNEKPKADKFVIGATYAFFLCLKHFKLDVYKKIASKEKLDNDIKNFLITLGLKWIGYYKHDPYDRSISYLINRTLQLNGNLSTTDNDKRLVLKTQEFNDRRQITLDMNHLFDSNNEFKVIKNIEFLGDFES